MYELPITIEIESKAYHIRNKGDFRMVIDCFDALQDIELDTEYRIYAALFIFYEDFETIEEIVNVHDIKQLIEKMFWFFNCGEPEVKTNKPDYKLIDWEKDSHLISSAINGVIQKEIRLEPYVHWWTFMGYYNAIGECPLSTIVSIRKKIAEQKNLEKHEREFKRDNPQYFTMDYRSTSQKELDNSIYELWNSGDKKGGNE